MVGSRNSITESFMLLNIQGVKALTKDYGRYATYMKALSDATRVEIFDMLSNGELCACDILEKFSITQPTLSYHMKILCESGLVDSKRDGVWMKYSINKNNHEQIKEFFDRICESITHQR